MSDPLVSPTLAQLYLAQGLHGRARAILDQLLALDGQDGVALALRDRLRVRGRPELVVARTAEGLSIAVAWPEGIDAVPAEVVCALWSRRRPSAWITSSMLDGTTILALPREFRRSGSATLTLVRPAVDSGPGRLRVLSVAEPVSW